MKKLRLSVVMVAVFAVGILAGCSQTATKSPDVSDSIRKSLDQAGFKDVTPTVPIMSETSSPSLINVGRRENSHLHEQDRCQTDEAECCGVGGSGAEGGRA
jgi:hypothetical protein